MSLNSTVTLPNSVKMPRLGFGVFQIYPSDCLQACLCALESGYRHIDSASLYRNEAEVGEAVRKSGIDRAQVFLTTKIGQPSSTKEETYKKALDSVTKVDGEDGYVDLFLVHIPHGGAEARKTMWITLEQLYEEGKAKSIGVSNYEIEHIEEMKEYARIWPPHVNQIFLNPWIQQRELDAYCKGKGIVVQAYSSLAEGTKFQDSTLVNIAKTYDKSPAQILIRYSLQKGWVPLAKSLTKERMENNLNVYDFEITDEDMHSLDGLDGLIKNEW